MDYRQNCDFLTWPIGYDSPVGTNSVWNEETSRFIFKGEAYYNGGGVYEIHYAIKKTLAWAK
jgi:hypothetical protein